MALTYRQATDLILELIKSTWAAGAPAVVGGAYTPGLLYEPTDRDRTPTDPHKAWARVNVVHDDNTQTAMGAQGAKLFERRGYVLVECFAPYLDGSGYSTAQDLAEVAVDAYEGRSNGRVWFMKGPTMREMGQVGPWYQIDVLANFSWDRVR